MKPPKTSYKKDYKKSSKAKKIYRKNYRSLRMPKRITSAQEYYTLTFAYRLNQASLTSGVIGYHMVNIGSIYDPMGASSTRKFYGANEVFMLYKYATVMSAKVSLTCLSPYTDTSPIVTMMTLQPDSPQDVNINELADFYETPIRKSGIQTFGSSLTKNLQYNNTIRLLYSAKKFYGAGFDNTDTDYAATKTSNPTISPHVGIYSISPDATTSQSVNFMLRITAIVRAWQPIALDNTG